MSNVLHCGCVPGGGLIAPHTCTFHRSLGHVETYRRSRPLTPAPSLTDLRSRGMMADARLTNLRVFIANELSASCGVELRVAEHDCWTLAAEALRNLEEVLHRALDVALASAAEPK